MISADKVNLEYCINTRMVLPVEAPGRTARRKKTTPPLSIPSNQNRKTIRKVCILGPVEIYHNLRTHHLETTEENCVM